MMNLEDAVKANTQDSILRRVAQIEEGFRAFQAFLAVVAIALVVVASIVRAVSVAKARTTTKAARAAAKIKVSQ